MRSRTAPLATGRCRTCRRVLPVASSCVMRVGMPGRDRATNCVMNSRLVTRDTEIWRDIALEFQKSDASVELGGEFEMFDAFSTEHPYFETLGF
ncbi:hypothetical protein ALC62_10820 [Cyphomyrmex costatus]|uniref:Uncharacterized protein n=1 Tax=Cyphomyrmex costatus TaxID=456900 RepID=A0A195CC79_9HYME|nr:hypothetical protein ALC62_10820 [Cyphomyrmex costatus]